MYYIYTYQILYLKDNENNVKFYENNNQID